MEKTNTRNVDENYVTPNSEVITLMATPIMETSPGGGGESGVGGGQL